MPTEAVGTVASSRAPRGGAKALLLTVLGEFVLPAGGSAWTATLVTAMKALGIGEKNARQAIARVAEQGLISPTRHGRSVQWSLSDEGRRLLESGTERIYGFGRSVEPWDGRWLVAHCQVAESQRSRRDQLRTQLGFLGFGELSPSLFVSPHVSRESQLQTVLTDLELHQQTIVMTSTMTSPDVDVVATAWNLDELDAAYRDFGVRHENHRAPTDETAFAAVVNLVHDWRRFPSIDPELPAELVPSDWGGTAAAAAFDRCHESWSVRARRWFTDLDAANSSGR